MLGDHCTGTTKVSVPLSSNGCWATCVPFWDTVTTTGRVPSVSTTVMDPWPLAVSQVAEALKSPMLQANALPATPSASAAAAEATPMERTAMAVRRFMDTSSLHGIGSQSTRGERPFSGCVDHRL